MVNTDIITDKCVFYVGTMKPSARSWAAAKGYETLHTKYISDETNVNFPFNSDKGGLTL